MIIQRLLLVVVLLIFCNFGVNGLSKEIVDKCSRNYEGSNAWEKLNHIVNHLNSDLLKTDQLDSRQMAWKQLAAFYVPMPQWRREEITKDYCKRVGYSEEECIHKIFWHENASVKSLRNTGLLSGLVHKSYDNIAKMFEMMIVPREQALGERLFGILENPQTEFGTVYEILLSQPKIVIRKIIEYYEKFNENIQKNYGKKDVEEILETKSSKIENSASAASENKSDISKMSDDYKINPESYSTLILHILLKGKKEKDLGIKKIYEILAKRIYVIDNDVDFNDFDFEKMIDRVVDMCPTQQSDDEIGTQLNVNERILLQFENFAKRVLNKLLIRFEVDSDLAKRFSEEINKYCPVFLNYTVPQKNLLETRLAKFKNSEDGKPKTQEEIFQEKNKLTKKLIEKQSYLGELAKMLKVSGLAGKIHYNREMRQSLKKNHDNRNYDGIINFVAIHLDHDCNEILSEYGKENQKEKEGNTF
uniref:Uncharacterized protein n=1 Tax=Meloidogyne enterolobii TaxID=390850 RepID=A0A6V7V8C4_MELEN|nr:unnamed protein product [Meloidogyne enterolobii]